MRRTVHNYNKKQKNKNRNHIFLAKERHFLRSPFLKIIKYFHIVTQSLFFTNVVLAQEDVVSENTYVPDFRAGHNLALFYSAEYSNWTLKQNSTSVESEKIKPLSQTAVNSGFFIRYSYHINIISNFGFFVGTTTGLLIDMTSYGQLKQGYAVAFPTIMAGLALNIGQKFRIFSGAEYGAIWYPEMSITTDMGTAKVIAPVPDMYSVFGGFDYFFAKDKSLLFQMGWRRQNVMNLNNGSSNTYLNTLSIENNSYFAQFGVIFQIGDINQAIGSVLPRTNF